MGIPGQGGAQETAAQAMRQSFAMQLFFWSTAFVLAVIMGRFIFREQLSERRTIRRLTDEISPFFPEFGLPSITHWVELCAPHIWLGWTGSTLYELEDFATSEFLAELRERGEFARAHPVEAVLASVVKVHPLLILKGEDATPPEAVELIIRVEQRGVYCVRTGNGAVAEGSPKARDIQHFWTLIHDGRGWRIHKVWSAQEDLKNFPPDREVPPVSTTPAATISS